VISARLLTCSAVAAVVALTGSTPALATIVNPPKYREAFDDTVCGIPAHVVIVADNPIIETGLRTASR
jgi:hypothetical protein